MGLIVDVSVSLLGFSHTFPDDVGVLLVAPTGVGQIVFDGGTFDSIQNANLTFADGGAAWPSAGPVASGTFQPFSFYTDDLFPGPAPLIAGVNPTTAGVKSLSVFDGIDPNGLWSLYVFDFFPGAGSGAISGGWNLTITDPAGPVIPEPASLLLLGTGLAGIAARRRSNGSYFRITKRSITSRSRPVP